MWELATRTDSQPSLALDFKLCWTWKFKLSTFDFDLDLEVVTLYIRHATCDTRSQSLPSPAHRITFWYSTLPISISPDSASYDDAWTSCHLTQPAQLTIKFKFSLHHHEVSWYRYRRDLDTSFKTKQSYLRIYPSPSLNNGDDLLLW